MSKPVFSDLFTFSGRRNRKSFILFTIIGMAALLGLWFGISLIVGNDEPPILLIIAGALLTAVIVVADFAVSVQRIHDFGWSGWALLITVLPVVGQIFDLALCCVPGTRGPNKYGPDPLEPPSSSL